jgi:hypothetical protein
LPTAQVVLETAEEQPIELSLRRKHFLSVLTPQQRPRLKARTLLLRETVRYRQVLSSKFSVVWSLALAPATQSLG